MLPLANVKVLEFAQVIFGGLTTQLLGDLGAEVIKVEPPEGEAYRGRLYATTDPGAVSNPRWLSVNRNKRSLAIDLKHPEAGPIIDRLIHWCDVLVENLRPGVPERLGFGLERCRELNPGIIYVSLTGFGESGPWAHRQGADLYAQALAGNVAVQGSPGGEPYVGGTAFVDHGAPLAAAYGIMAALFRRERTGQGALVTVNLLDTALYMQTSSSFTDYLNGEEMVEKSGRGWSAGFPYGAYTAADGEVVTMLVTDEQWDAFLDALDLQELRGQERFATHELRVKQRHELYPILDRAFKKRTRAEWSEIFAQKKIIRADPALRYDEVPEHPQVQANQSIITIPHTQLGAILGIASPVAVDGVRTDIRWGPPAIGEHSRIVLSELGLEPAEVQKLVDEGVVRDGSADLQFGEERVFGERLNLGRGPQKP